MSLERQKTYITEARQRVRAIWDALDALEALQREWTALAYGDTLPDGSGPHEGITRAQVGSAVFDTTTALRGVLQGGHATNFARLL